jgi:hypothetical protein
VLLPAIFCGCASESGSEAVSAKSPLKATPTSNVAKLQAWKDAETIASLGEGRVEVVGSGESMQPVYGDNSILVISKINYDDLRPGMTVAYLNQKNHQVVHQLLEKDVRGWRIQGLNNEEEDTDRVTRDNLLGVIYASLAFGENW